MERFRKWATAMKIQAPGVRIDEAEPGAGYGVFANEVHLPESLMIRMPHSVLLTAGSIADMPKYKKMLDDFSQKMAPFEILTLFFCLEESSSSKYGPYLDILPKKFDTPAADGIRFDPAEIPQSAREFYKLQLKELDVVWAKLTLFAEELSKPITHEKYLWAWHVVNTRCIYLENPSHPLVDSTDGDTLAVIPFVDMLNHTPTAQGFAFYDKIRNEYCLRATRTVNEGDQIFVCYGPHDNVRLWIEYGFRLSANPNGKVSIPQDLLVALAMKAGVEVSDRHVKALEEAAQPSTIYASDEGPSWSLRTNMQILLMPKAELKKWKDYVYAEDNRRRRLRTRFQEKDSDDEDEQKDNEDSKRERREREALRKMLVELAMSLRSRAEKVDPRLTWAWIEQAEIVDVAANSLL